MAALRLYTDEDIYGVVTIALRGAGMDVVSSPEAGRLGESDESQLQWSSDAGRAIVTFNVAHFVQLHTVWLSTGRHHHGIVVSSQRSVGDTIRRLSNLAGALESEAMRDRLEFLSSW